MQIQSHAHLIQYHDYAVQLGVSDSTKAMKIMTGTPDVALE